MDLTKSRWRFRAFSLWGTSEIQTCQKPISGKSLCSDRCVFGICFRWPFRTLKKWKPRSFYWRRRRRKPQRIRFRASTHLSFSKHWNSAAIPTTYWELNDNFENTGHTLFPNYSINPKIKELIGKIDKKDSVLDFVLKLIQENAHNMIADKTWMAIWTDSKNSLFYDYWRFYNWRPSHQF